VQDDDPDKREAPVGRRRIRPRENNKGTKENYYAQSGASKADEGNLSLSFPLPIGSQKEDFTVNSFYSYKTEFPLRTAKPA